MSVEWHESGDHKYLYSFDVREDASRFIVVTNNPTRTLMLKGLIERGQLGKSPMPLLDPEPAIPEHEETRLALASCVGQMLWSWLVMSNGLRHKRERLRAGKGN